MRIKSSRLCSIPGCGRPHECRGLCNAHYARLCKYGDARADIPIASYRPYKPRTRTPVEPRFWERVTKTDTCWLIPPGSAGYGLIGVNGQRIRAHRYSWELHYGPIPDGMEVCHHCDVPTCVRPDHLFLGSHAENMADMAAKNYAKHPHRKPAPRLQVMAERDS